MIASTPFDDVELGQTIVPSTMMAIRMLCEPLSQATCALTDHSVVVVLATVVRVMSGTTVGDVGAVDSTYVVVELS